MPGKIMERNDLEKWKARELAQLLALAEAEKGYYQDIIATLPVGLLVLSDDLSIISVNRSVRKILGVHGADCLRGRLDGLMPGSVIESVREVLTTGIPQDGLLIFTALNGGRHLRIGIHPIRHLTDSGAEAMLTIEDVTDLRRPVSTVAKSESPLEATELVENLEAAVWVVDIPRMRFLFVNKPGQTLLGFDIEHWLGTGEFWQKRIHPTDRERVLRTYRGAIDRPAAHGGRVTCEYRAVTARDTTVWLREMARVLSDSEGHPRYLIGVSIDITQRHQLEQQLVRSNRMDAIGKLAGRLLHDLNNLLMIVTGYGEELLGRVPAGNPLRDDIQQILAASERVGALTNQLLTFTRRQPASPAVIELGGTLQAIEVSLRAMLGDSIELKVEPAPHPIAVQADLIQFQQVMRALVRRARDVMPRGGQLLIGIKRAHITEDWRLPDAPLRSGEYAIITIQDDGPQYDAEARAALFESFLANGQDQENAPMLSQAYAFVRQWGGDISVEPGPTKGEIFQIFVPFVGESIQAPVAFAERRTGPAAETILVVDDEDGIRLLVGKILRREGYKVLEARDGKQAISLFQAQRERIDLVIADVTMPEMDGPELVEHLRRLQHDIKVLYISGYAADTTLRIEDLAPETAFLRKPFTLGSLLDRVREMIPATR